VIFTIEVTNDGKDDVTGVEVTDILPNGYSYVSDDAAGNYDAISGIWNAGAIATGNAVSLNITATVNPTGDYDNVAEITGADNLDSDSTVNNNDPSEDDQDNAGATPQAASDLSLTKVVDISNPNVGADVVFTITVNNDGPSDATGIEVVDVLPSGYTYVSDDSSGLYDNGTGLWTTGNIASGSSATLNITATVNVSGDYFNSAEVTASDNSDSDSTPGNGDASEDDQDSAGVTPNPVSDLELSKVVDNTTPLVGDNVIFTITVSNNGPSDATGIVVTDALPSGYNYVSDDSGATYVPGTGVWTLATLAAGGSDTINISAQVNASGEYFNQAEITASDNIVPDSSPNI
jgi:uncharacterized repeat protein (TIGR01451 family)